MITQLQERHRPLFSALDAPAVGLVFRRVVETWPQDVRRNGHDPASGEELFDICRDAGLDHARVVLSLAREVGSEGRRILETLVGHPILPWAASVEALNPPAKPRLQGRPKDPCAVAPRHDTRVVVSVEPNPHREGTGMWTAYNKWVIGRTVHECMTGGVPRRSIRRDVRRGHVVLGAPRE